ncbi:hypothetical protein [Luteolibacter sp. Populi]|uniref:hypothetical protein n=1 Tax=Luteolibacter sp. Populi TaxID=3230487 RepID=UPI00346686F9
MIATIQCITVRWTKLSRGAPNSAKRAAVPMGFPLQPVALPKKALRTAVLHWVNNYEEGDFAPLQSSEVHDITGVRDYDTEMAMLKFEADDLRVEYKGGFWCAGAPQRPNIIRSVFKLQPGQWGRIAANGRFSHDNQWHYYRKVLNIAFTDALPTAGIFRGKPAAEFRDEHDLW